ncbi:right-handed parallel beta-helix repeat-containing protein [Parabacteroides sp. PF5-6]|uniref:right-handed parallel beta-helix repeat-containing protein n=1 Tax=Parabacteroides sp. PF5-6 TaxID=1742403 RepID=UPI002404B6B0|nr:right-handed parallel beta-helix repeat-containing protein [Parabacteroides sp. PF5-6]MDF9830919.1 putative outer membrane repeat protein [Parabacteroides sp. PF5-6]
MRRLSIFWIALFVFHTAFAQSRYYVNGEKGSDDKDGSSWELAFATLDKALQVTDDNDSIFIARGTYYPSSYRGIDEAFTYWGSFDRELAPCDYTFLIRNNVQIYGGFEGNNPDETLEERNLEANRTVLSGNLKEEETNACHVVVMLGTSEKPITPLLDGLWITEGYALGTFNEEYSMSMSDHIVIGNHTIQCDYGGGIYALNADFTLTQSTVAGNYGHERGGGIYIEKSAQPRISHTTISGNTATGPGGGIYNETSTPEFSNITVGGNFTKAKIGAGIYNNNNSQATILHSIIWGNITNENLSHSIGNSSVGYDILASTTLIAHSVVEGSSVDGYFCKADCEAPYIKESEPGTVYDRDPSFVNPIIQNPDTWPPTTEGDYNLNLFSKVFFANGRLFIMEGAEEQEVVADADSIIYVRQGAEGNGSSWENAHPSLTDVIHFNNAQEKPYTIYIAGGTYTPEHYSGKTTADQGIIEQNYTFLIRKSMSIYGGFRGDGEEAIDERDLVANSTVLSGKLSEEVYAYHVVSIHGEKGAELHPYLNGLTIRDGRANDTECQAISSNGFENCNGAGLYNFNAGPHFEQVIFTDNQAVGYGGAIYNKRMLSDTTLLTLSMRDVAILSNQAGRCGGGIWNQDLIAGERVRIAGNTAGTSGGGIFDCGVVYLSHSFLTGNQANTGGAIGYNVVSSFAYYTDEVPTMNQVTTRAGNWESSTETDFAPSKQEYSVIADNRAIQKNGGGAFYSHQTIPMGFPWMWRTSELENSIVWGNIAGGEPNSSNVPLTEITNSLVYGPNSEEGDGPGFFGPTDPTDDDWQPNTDGDYTLPSTSPVFNIIKEGVPGNLPVLTVPQIEAGNTLYVNAQAKGDGSGKDWTNAFLSLADAITYNNTLDEPHPIYVAKGTYRPENTSGFQLDYGGSLLTERDRTFLITNDQQIYGGFRGDDMTETPDQRDLKRNRTILSGETGSDDHIYHVVVAWGTADDDRISPLFDGLTISGGQADGRFSLADDDQLKQSQGGGLLNLYADTKLVRVRFEANEAVTGGAVFNESGSLSLTNGLIAKNNAEMGGGMYSQTASSLLTNVTLAENTATESGAGIYNDNSEMTSYNTMIWGNRKEEEPDNVVNDEDSSSDYANSLLEGGGVEGVIDIDPELTADYYAQHIYPGTFRGSAEWYPKDVSLFDLEGNKRLSNSGKNIFMGAFENVARIPVYHTLTIPEVEGVTTEPGPGIHTVEEDGHLVLYLTLDADFTDSAIRLWVNDKEMDLKEISPGRYMVIIPIGTEDCVITIGGVTRSQPTGNIHPEKDGWQIYTSSGNLHITPPTAETKVTVYTAAGIPCFAQTLTGTVNIPLATGIYLIRAEGLARKVFVD